MGNKNSRNKKTNKEETQNDSRNLSEGEMRVQYLKHMLEEKPQEFLLNEILLSIQFFENYERDVTELRNSLTSEHETHQSKLNSSLISYQKSCLIPDIVASLVNKHVKFCPLHGSKKNTCETLVPQRLYIHHENIEIEKELNPPDYSKVEGPIYRCVLKDITKIVNETTKKEESTGYVTVERIGIVPNEINTEREEITESPVRRIQLKPEDLENHFSPPLTPNTTKYQKTLRSSLSPLPLKDKFVFPETENDGRLSKSINRFFRNDSPKSPIRKNSKNMENISNYPENIEEEYGYNTITNLTTKRSLEESRSGKNLSDLATLPENCFLVEKPDIENIEIDDNDDDSEKDKYYINSEVFVKHFGDVFEKLYPILGFSEEDKVKAECQGGIIYINKEITLQNFDLTKSVINYEIYPALLTNIHHLPTEWTLRQRKFYSINNREEQFPTLKMIRTLKTFGASVLPAGRLAKRGRNENYAKEWSITFPRVERYLQTYLNHSQMRCYLFVLTLFKSFVEIENPQLGLNTYHIRTVLYWLCEENWKDFHETTLGEKFIQVLTKLERCLSNGYLNDYFIHQRNLFESTPSKYLRISQERIYRILEYPVTYTISALRNLKYFGFKFPLPNFMKLYEIISVLEPLKILNSKVPINIVENEEKRNSFDENKKSLWERERGKSKTKDKTQMKRQKKMEKFYKEKKTKQQSTEERKISVDAIKKEIPVRKEYYDNTRKILVVEFFAKHFVELASNYMDCKNFYQAEFFLNHSEALIRLWDIFDSTQTSKPLKNKLASLQADCAREKIKYVPPPIPARTSQIITNTPVNNTNETSVQQVEVDIHNTMQKSQQNNVKFEINKKEHKDEMKIAFSIDLNHKEDENEEREDVISIEKQKEQNKFDLIQSEEELSKSEEHNPILQNVFSDSDPDEIKEFKLNHVETVKEVKKINDVQVSSKLLLATLITEKKSIMKKNTNNEVSLDKKEDIKGVKFHVEDDSDGSTDL